MNNKIHLQTQGFMFVYKTLCFNILNPLAWIAEGTFIEDPQFWLAEEQPEVVEPSLISEHGAFCEVPWLGFDDVTVFLSSIKPVPTPPLSEHPVAVFRCQYLIVHAGGVVEMEPCFLEASTSGGAWDSVEGLCWQSVTASNGSKHI